MNCAPGRTPAPSASPLLSHAGTRIARPLEPRCSDTHRTGNGDPSCVPHNRVNTKWRGKNGFQVLPAGHTEISLDSTPRGRVECAVFQYAHALKGLVSSSFRSVRNLSSRPSSDRHAEWSSVTSAVCCGNNLVLVPVFRRTLMSTTGVPHRLGWRLQQPGLAALPRKCLKSGCNHPDP